MLALSKVDFSDFYFNGRWLSELGGRIAGLNGLHPFSVIPAKEIKTEKILGMDGELVYSSRYQPRTFVVPVFFENIENIREIALWLSPKEPKDFHFKGDEVKLQVMLDSAIDIQNYCLQGITELKFIAHNPYFQTIKNQIRVYLTDLTNVKTFQNKGNVESAPLIEVYGHGDIVIELNGELLKFKNVSTCVKMDNLYYTVYQGNTKNKITDFEGNFTTLKVGDNTLKLTSGNCTSINIHCRHKWI